VGSVVLVDDLYEALSDEELAELALAADPEAPLPDDAEPFDPTGGDGEGLLPSWYMPAPVGGVAAQPGWRRRVGILVVATFLAINAAGLCSTYGPPFGI
jgi:hypothetical protein